MAQRAGSLTRGFILELDGLRGIAILMVMIHRFWPRHGARLGADIAGTGWIGVDLFFVISGFLIAGILLDTKGDPGYFRNFYARRALRIFPLYYLFVIGVLVAFSHNPEFRRLAGSPLWYLFYLGNVPEGLLNLNVPYWLAPVWSLAIEEQFYVTFPWLVRWLDRRRLTIALVTMIAIAPVIRLVTMLAFPEHERVQYLFTLCRIDTIAIGCLLAVAVRSLDVEKWRHRAKLAACLVLPTVAVLAVASRLDRTSPFDRVLGYSVVAVGCASVVLLVVLARGQRTTAALRNRALTYFGKLCFGLYLLHRPADTLVSAAAARLHVHHDLWLVLPKIAVALGLATLSWYLVERRFLRLKDRFATSRHPKVIAAAAATALLVGCHGISGGALPGDDAPVPDGGVGIVLVDSRAPDDTLPPDGAVSPSAPVLYPENVRHSPITPALAAQLQQLVAAGTQPRVFAKVGDSITVATSFLSCFDGGTIDLAGRGDLATTLGYFMAGNAAGTTPFARISLVAKGGTTASYAITGSPPPLDQEITAIDPRIAVVMYGTNEARTGVSLQDFGANLWAVIDDTLASGAIPIMSTIPPNVGYPDADARVPTFNRVVRAIAQGRGIPLVDFHRELEPLPNRGISSDGLHPSVAPDGGCVLNAAGLQYGYNVRNLITLEALGRVRQALAGSPPDATAATRAGSGRETDPYIATLPLLDLGDTRTGEPQTNHGCATTTGHQIAYRVALAAPATLDAYVIERAPTDVGVRIVSGTTCVTGDASATATVPAGTVEIVIFARSPASDGEYVLVVEAR